MDVIIDTGPKQVVITRPDHTTQAVVVQSTAPQIVLNQRGLPGRDGINGIDGQDGAAQLPASIDGGFF